MINNRLVNTSIIVTGVATIMFVIFPDWDLAVSGLFYSPVELDFIYKRNSIVYFFFDSVPILAKLFIITCLIYLICIICKYKSFKKTISSWVIFLVISGAIGPGLVVNYVFKEHSGRARPTQIVEFDGKKQFSPALTISDQCSTNCSFSSGHASMAFYFTALAYVASHLYFTRIYLLGLGFGVVVSVSRIIMGGHFISDVLASAFIVLLFNHLIYFLWKRKTSEQTK